MQLTQLLDVGDQVGGGVGAQIGIGLAGQRAAAARPALVEQHDPVGIWIKVTPRVRRRT
jgi:hypothetical protein